jgi:hypothetical protein
MRVIQNVQLDSFKCHLLKTLNQHFRNGGGLLVLILFREASAASKSTMTSHNLTQFEVMATAAIFCIIIRL